MSRIPAELAFEVRERAGNRCEYCGLSQEGQEATFHIDHIQPRSEHGPTTGENLALACVSCSLRKAARVEFADPHSNDLVRLFHPRSDIWNEHFRWEGTSIVGLSPSGRATIEANAMNRPIILLIREEEIARGRHPPQTLTSTPT